MKKAILAVVIPTLLAGASSVSAYDFIKNDDMKFNVNGDIDFKIAYKDAEGSDSSTSTNVNFDDIDFDLEWYASDDLKYVSAFDFTVEPGETKEAGVLDNSDEAWVGVDSKKYGRLTAGRVLLPFDGFGIDTSEIDAGQASSFTDADATKAQEGYIYAYQLDDVQLSVGYGYPGSEKERDESIQVKALYKADGVEATFGIAKTTEFTSKKAVTNVVAIQADYAQKFGDFTLAGLIGFETVDFTGASSANEDFRTTAIELDVAYNITKTLRVSTGMDYVKQDIDGLDDYTDFFIASRLTLAKNAYLHAEIFQAQGDIKTFSSGSIGNGKSGDLTKAQLYLNLQF